MAELGSAFASRSWPSALLAGCPLIEALLNKRPNTMPASEADLRVIAIAFLVQALLVLLSLRFLELPRLGIVTGLVVAALFLPLL